MTREPNSRLRRYTGQGAPKCSLCEGCHREAACPLRASIPAALPLFASGRRSCGRCGAQGHSVRTCGNVRRAA